MKKEVEELIRILAKEEERKELLKEIVKGEFRSMVKELLEEVVLVEREALNSLSKVRKKHREAIAEDIQQVYRQLNEERFKAALIAFCLTQNS
jgi:cytoplasmic iron level regulating protein YaaA (DUF328/UPF0246 family)